MKVLSALINVDCNEDCKEYELSGQHRGDLKRVIQLILRTGLREEIPFAAAHEVITNKDARYADQ